MQSVLFVEILIKRIKNRGLHLAVADPEFQFRGVC